MTEAISSALNFMDAPVDHLLAHLARVAGRPSRRRRYRRRAARRRRSSSGSTAGSSAGSPPNSLRSDVVEILAKGHPRAAWPCAARRARGRAARRKASELPARSARTMSSRPCRHSTLRKSSTSGESLAPNTRSSSCDLLFLIEPAPKRTRPRAREYCSSTSATEVEFFDQGVGLSGRFRRAQKGLGIDGRDLLRADVDRLRFGFRIGRGINHGCLNVSLPERVSCGPGRQLRCPRETWPWLPESAARGRPATTWTARSCRPGRPPDCALRSASDSSAWSVAASMSRSARTRSASAPALASARMSCLVCSASRRASSISSRTSLAAPASFCSYSANRRLGFVVAPLGLGDVVGNAAARGVPGPAMIGPQANFRGRPAESRTRRASTWPGPDRHSSGSLPTPADPGSV